MLVNGFYLKLILNTLTEYFMKERKTSHCWSSQLLTLFSRTNVFLVSVDGLTYMCEKGKEEEEKTAKKLN